jgi:hypothetical protein
MSKTLILTRKFQSLRKGPKSHGFTTFSEISSRMALLRPPGVDVGNINSTIVGTVNSGNIGSGGIVGPPVVSPEQP